MSRRAAATQAEIARVIKGARRAGLDVSGVQVDGTKIIVLTDGRERVGSNSETDELDRELAEFEAGHGQS